MGRGGAWNQVLGIFFPFLPLTCCSFGVSLQFFFHLILLNHKMDLTNARGSDVCGAFPANSSVKHGLLGALLLFMAVPFSSPGLLL